jgi:hypothetical protein
VKVVSSQDKRTRLESDRYPKGKIQTNTKTKFVTAKTMKNFQPMLAIALGRISVVAKEPSQNIDVAIEQPFDRIRIGII